ncbi:DUF2268 domain-containing putative Zn-dependent protease [Neolewinella persica]|uniref:DUF2268 domain-containing putative Zn-dependent protease n=1 Tax=Neolewinella persica TaxID=70998 RepID=UPI00037643FD|nr:DUF2268 domain-containing putative Zn-dependent protease [Neolewinella persica]
MRDFIVLVYLIPMLLLIACDRPTSIDTEVTSPNPFAAVETIADSIRVGDMVIHNGFKFQVLAGRAEGGFDSLMIRDKLYAPNRQAFDNCLSMIFGEENAGKFQLPGMYAWNKTLHTDHGKLMAQKLSLLDTVNLNELFTSHLTALQTLTERRGHGRWMVYFGPPDFQIFGGCDNNSMILDMFGDSWNAADINDLFAHELEHLIFGPIAEKDVHGATGLGITLDEGLAVYYTYKYLNQSREEALYQQNTAILMQREKEIFEKLQPYLFKTSEEGCPIFRHCGRTNECPPLIEGLPEKLEGELCYFLGFRIIEQYVERHGPDAWKDLYTTPFKVFYEQSGYAEYVQRL